MTGRNRRFAFALALLPCVALQACDGSSASTSTLSIEGSYSGTTESSCQIALRTSDGAFVESHSLPSSFHQDYAVPAQKASYFVEIHCPDGKSGISPPFDFEPPRTGMDLRDIPLN